MKKPASSPDDIVIEKGIPAPVSNPRSKHGEFRYPYAKLKVGESFLVRDITMNRIAGHTFQACKKLNRKFIGRTVAEGVRVWRTE
jgi:hypothetical protein